MKKIALNLISTHFSSRLDPFKPNPASTDKSALTAVSKPTGSDEAIALLQRLFEINTLDKSNLDSTSQEIMQQEVRSINRQLRIIGGIRYFSASAILIIILLFIGLL